MPISFVTWNTQGNPLNCATKRPALQAMIGAYDFVLLQECGALADHNTYAYNPPNSCNVSGGEQSGAFNNRCSTAILSRHGGNTPGSIYLQSGTGRWCITLELPTGAVVATLHAYSGDMAGTDRTGVLKQLDKLYPNAGQIIVGGDWNAAPPVGGTFSTGTARSGTTWNISNPGVATHNSGKELDYFYYKGAVVTVGAATLAHSGGDHLPVAFTIA